MFIGSGRLTRSAIDHEIIHPAVSTVLQKFLKTFIIYRQVFVKWRNECYSCSF